jgi:hypothetical protein
VASPSGGPDALKQPGAQQNEGHDPGHSQLDAGLFGFVADGDTSGQAEDGGIARRETGQHEDRNDHQGQGVDPLPFQDGHGLFFGGLAHDVVHLGFPVHHHVDAVKIHDGRENGDQHDAGIRHPGQFSHDEAARAHDGRHEHAADGGRRFDTAGDVGPETGLFHHGDREGPGGHRVGNGAAGNRAEQAAGDNGHLGRPTDFVAHGRQGPVDKEFLGAAMLEKGPEQDEEQHVGGQDVGHDAENAVGPIENTGAQSGQGVAGMGQQVGHDVAVHAVSDHDDAHDDKDIAHDPAGQFHADQHAHDGHPLIHQVFSPGAVVDGLEIVHPVADGHNRCHNEKVVHRAHDLALGLIEQESTGCR